MMVPQFIGLFRSRPRSRARSIVAASYAAIERLEERTLLSANLALFNGSFAGNYKGAVTVNNNGTITNSTISSTAWTGTITNGVVAVTTPVGNGTGTINSNGNVVGTVNSSYDGIAVPIAFSGTVTAVNASGITMAGQWSYSVNLGNGVSATGTGSWSGTAAAVLSDFNGNYAGSYQGSTSLNNNGTITKSTVNTTAVTAVINNGAITVTFPAPTGLSSGPSTITINGAVNGTASFVEDGVTITVNYTGTATRSLTGVTSTGTWSFAQNFGSGITYTGSGSWNLHSVLVFDGSYTGSYSGTVVDTTNGSSTSNPIPGTILSNVSLQMTISNGTVSVVVPGINSTGTGTIDQNGNIVGTVTYLEDGVTVTINFSGTAVQTAAGTVIAGTWNYSANLPGGTTETGTGNWTA
jgi:hypothetical protein